MDAEKVSRRAVRTLKRGDEQSLLAEALTTLGIALARLRHYGQARTALERAIDGAQQAGDVESAGNTALAMIEELGSYLSHKNLLSDRKPIVPRKRSFTGEQRSGRVSELRKQSAMEEAVKNPRSGNQKGGSTHEEHSTKMPMYSVWLGLWLLCLSGLTIKAQTCTSQNTPPVAQAGHKERLFRCTLTLQ